ncbi:microfibril-associated glycoprotein 4-like [Uranotaenia lowii]|uniref:microfibril-associated glycoprotein 4-like n=1 Tax=Uranotaenia lowii TaxID=190385 RepID=UPI002478EFA5|nr:microfibril-associated glycoprotein 4-like [Uranotaenia lowii]
MLIKQFKIYLVALVLCGSVPKILCSSMGYERFGASLDTINSRLNNLTQSLTEHRQTYQSDMEKLWQKMKILENFVGKNIDKLPVSSSSSNDGYIKSGTSDEREEAPRTCYDVRNSPSGIHQLHSKKRYGAPYGALCDNDYSGGGWTVIQKRFDGSVDFYRGWKDYEDGFGDLQGEFWLGLETIHELTSSKRHELHVLLEDFEGNSKVATYDDFRVADEAEKYRLESLGRHNGTAEDSLTYHRGQKFSTFDADNDSDYYYNCAEDRSGAWWYYECAVSNLNGKYLGKGVKDNKKGMFWLYFHNSLYSLKSSRMMIREKI